VIPGLLIGFGVGVLLTSLIAWQLLRRHLRRVRQAERRARNAERMAEIGAMTGGLAHEIKNPLSTIGLNAQLLAEAVGDLDLPDHERSRLTNRTKALRREAERLTGILADFLEFAGQVHLDPRSADAAAVVLELADFFTPEAERHGVKVRITSPPAPVPAVFDVKLVKQAVLNLMLNATQAMGGSGADHPRELLLRAEPDRDHDGTPVVRIRVTDTGPGIPPETLARIFEPYFTTKSGGSGLGLPTSRRLIEEHGGRLEVHSEVGKGTEFAVVLPVTPSTHAPKPPGPGGAPGR
jgi:signal transduction histidine kinase